MKNTFTLTVVTPDGRPATRLDVATALLALTEVGMEQLRALSPEHKGLHPIDLGAEAGGESGTLTVTLAPGAPIAKTLSEDTLRAAYLNGFPLELRDKLRPELVNHIDGLRMVERVVHAVASSPKGAQS